MPKLSRDEAIESLYRSKEVLETVTDKQQTINVISEAGNTVGFKPAFRALIMGKSPEDAIKWK